MTDQDAAARPYSLSDLDGDMWRLKSALSGLDGLLGEARDATTNEQLSGIVYIFADFANRIHENVVSLAVAQRVADAG